MLNKTSVNFNLTAHKLIFLKNKMTKSQMNVRKIKYSLNSRLHNAHTAEFLSKEDLQEKDISLIGQFDNKFLILMRKSDRSIIILDQHAIHERILYEFYSELLLNEMISSNHTLIHKQNPAKLNLFQQIYGKCYLKSPIIFSVVQRQINMKDFSSLFKVNTIHTLFHFDFKYDSKDSVTLLSIPVIFDKIHAMEFYLDVFISLIHNLREILDLSFSEGKTKYEVRNPNMLVNLFEEKIKSKACRDAVKFNEELELKYMVKLIESLSECKDPFLCAHGRHNFFLMKKK